MGSAGGRVGERLAELEEGLAESLAPLPSGHVPRKARRALLATAFAPVVAVAVNVLLANLAVDLLYGYLDPRIRVH